MIYKNIFKNKKIIVTGHTGFKGSWLTLWLVKLGAKVMEYPKTILRSKNFLEAIKIKT